MGALTELADFVGRDAAIRDKLARLAALRAALLVAPFFASHEVVGSSLLLLHDRRGNVGVWMIDFGKTVRHEGRKLAHDTFPDDHLQTRDEGYLIGLNNVVAAFRDCI